MAGWLEVDTLRFLQPHYKFPLRRYFVISRLRPLQQLHHPLCLAPPVLLFGVGPTKAHYCQLNSFLAAVSYPASPSRLK